MAEDVQAKTACLVSIAWILPMKKMCSTVKKWQTVIEAYVDVKTTGDYFLHLFCVAFIFIFLKSTNQRILFF